MKNNRLEEYKKINIYYKEQKLKLNITEIFDFLIQNYESSNNPTYNFNKYFDIELDSIELIYPIEYNI